MTSPVSKKYDFFAKTYDWYLLDYTHKTIPHAITLAKLSGHEHILDIGCGTGSLEAKILPQFPELHIDACDLSQGMIARAQHKLPHAPQIQFHVGDFTTLPFPTLHYDTIFALSNLHYFADVTSMLKHAHALAKPGASIILLDWEKGSKRSLLYERWMQRFDQAFQRIYPLEEMKHMLERAGWRYETHHSFSIRGFWTMFALRALKK